MIRDSRAEESALKVVRDDMVKAGLTRSTVNARKEGAGPVGGGSPRLRHQPPGRVLRVDSLQEAGDRIGLSGHGALH